MDSMTVTQKRTLNTTPTEFSADELAALSRMYEETMKDFVEGSIVPGSAVTNSRS